MKEEQLDKFIGKLVEITDFENDKWTGKLYKIVKSKSDSLYGELFHNVSNGYYLEGTRIGGIDFRKSHIKKIREIK